MKKYLLEGIEPVRVLRIFEDICAIPHGSRNEWRLGEYVLNIAGERGLEAQRDETGNIFIVLPATPGFEHIAPILLQGHMDMVCVKNPDCSKDLDREPIDLILDGNILRADGTSLGADNAVGLSNMIALMEEEGLLHPKIELLFTVCEEIGNEGIRRFDMTKIKA
ncbi:MAG TPA: M20/M25/M40 family metallo-hydrolase, partial [Bacillota bacterium]|nr:M20/M25/M40 family metallo-hydrolase [Bacillota bacterium]